MKRSLDDEDIICHFDEVKKPYRVNQLLFLGGACTETVAALDSDEAVKNLNGVIAEKQEKSNRHCEYDEMYHVTDPLRSSERVHSALDRVRSLFESHSLLVRTMFHYPQQRIEDSIRAINDAPWPEAFVRTKDTLLASV